VLWLLFQGVGGVDFSQLVEELVVRLSGMPGLA